MNLAAIASALNARLEGDGSVEINRVVHPSEAVEPGDLALAMEKGLAERLSGTAARTAVIAEGMAVPAGLDGCILVTRPRLAMAILMTLFEKPVYADPGIHPTAVVAADAVLGDAVRLGPFVTVGPRAIVGDRTTVLSHVSIGADAKLGPDCRLHAGVRIGDRVELGARVIVQPGAVIGADGFSFVTPEPGSVETAKATGQVGATNTALQRINSNGTVIVDDGVEIGANATIDRGTVSATRIGRNTKIDNLVQIGHNVEIGRFCLICGNVGIAGSSRIGDRVVLAGGVGVGDHLTIGNDAVVAAGSGVGTNIPPKSVYAGYPAVPRERAFDQMVHIGRLKTLFADVAKLKTRVKALEPGGEKG